MTTRLYSGGWACSFLLEGVTVCWWLLLSARLPGIGDEEADEQMDCGRPPSLRSLGSYLTGVIIIADEEDGDETVAAAAAFAMKVLAKNCCCCLGDDES